VIILTRSEQLVHALASDAFLSLWTYPNPIGKDKSKELCDVLVVCRPDIIIFSVKEIELKKDGDPDTQIDRWKRRAVDDSVSQIYGAERRLGSTEHVVTADGSKGVDLGPTANRVTHRVAVAIGSSGSVPLESKDYGSGFVHVFDEETLLILLQELDTITDFVEYLTAREKLITENRTGVIVGSEEDLLAAYFFGVHSFDGLTEGEHDLKVIVGSWSEFTQLPEYQRKKAADRVSYVWDSLISKVHEDYAAGAMEFGSDLASIDTVTRIMARESRFDRRYLSEAFTEFMDDPTKKSRMVLGNSGIGYVFLKQKHEEPREERVAELQARAFVVRDLMENQGRPGPVVGVATEIPEEGSGFSLDLLLVDIPEWTDELRTWAARARDELGLFKKPDFIHRSGDEFPRP
jgi:hypothetical protein